MMSDRPPSLPTSRPPDFFFSDFAETLHTLSTPRVIYFVFGVKCENFLMGLKIDFKFWILVEVGKIYKGISLIKFPLDFLYKMVGGERVNSQLPEFCFSLIFLKLCTLLVPVELFILFLGLTVKTFLWVWKSISSFEFWSRSENFIKEFPLKNLRWISFINGWGKFIRDFLNKIYNELPTSLPIKKGSLISLKLCT